MTFIDTVPVDEAQGDVAQMYDTDRELFGHVPNFTQAFSERPVIYAAWRQLNGSIKATMDLRRYELATLAAAAQLRSSYCCLAHGSVLVNQFLPAETVQGLVADAGQVTLADVERLRRLGLDDGEILEVVAAAAARCATR